MSEATDAEDIALRKAVRLERYAEVLAHIAHFGTDRTAEVVLRFGLSLERWSAVDRAWTGELALGLKRQQREQALRFSATFHSIRQRLARLQPLLDAVGDAPAQAPEITPASPPEAPARPSGVPSFMLASAAAPLPVAVSSPPAAFSGTMNLPLQTAPSAPVKPTPFLEGVPAEAALKSAVEHAGSAQEPKPRAPDAFMSETLPMDNEVSAIAARTLPFDRAKSGGAAPPARDPDLTLEQHVSIRVELSVTPERKGEILRRYGLSTDQLTRIDATWDARLLLDPKLRTTWEQAAARYRAWLLANPSR
ncbi:hypothetical protein [Polyangium aurulentum]|uniref:hypothetical protein n=1 Tax=Polyangium aurulentum TaxID=2567896 RepID=UPI0010ADB6DC|nr:hypothetical protein [Polyangium aurulentum]UQA57869.1 hypothetical protein E8A73_042435 [Polyangium aurulentum]